MRFFTASNNEEEPRTIIEIHRLSSPQFGYTKIVNAIFQSAMDKPYEIPDYTNTIVLDNLNTSSMQSNCSKREEQTGLEVLSHVRRMLNNDRYDSNSLGIESLVYLTNSQMTNVIIANLVANVILFGNTREFSQLQYKIYNLILWGSLDNKTSDGDDFDAFAENYNLKMRSDALRVLLNSLETIFSSSTDTADLSSTIWLADEFIDGFLNNLESATFIPHGAHDASTIVKCLQLLITNSFEFCDKLKERKKTLENIVDRAICIGSNCHELLAIDSKKLMAMLQSF